MKKRNPSNPIVKALYHPIMANKLDLTLMTPKELQILTQSEKEYKKIIQKRKGNDQLVAFIHDLKNILVLFTQFNYEELKIIHKICAIYEKNLRLQKLSADDKYIIRMYGLIHDHLVENPIFHNDPSNLIIGCSVNSYFNLMRSIKEEVYEKTFYFIDKNRKKRILEELSKLHSEILMNMQNEKKARKNEDNDI